MNAPSSPPRPARLGLADVVRVGGVGLRTRPLRGVLSALGIAIGIAAMVAVVGITTSGRADLDRTLSRIGTNLLRVAPGQQFAGGNARLPTEAEAMIGRIGPVTGVSSVAQLAGVNVYRTDLVPEAESGGISVLAARQNLLDAVGAGMAQGGWFSPATGQFPTVVLGDRAAGWLGVGRLVPGLQVWLGGQWFTVIGVLAPAPLAPELDGAALIGWEAAVHRLAFDGHPTTVFVRARESAIAGVRRVLAPTANPQHPDEVLVSRPSDALVAKAAANRALTRLLLGLGAVALVVGGVGVANTMVISVLERRSEVGLRRALGATRGQVRLQFFVESLLLSFLGGTAGAALGVGVTAVYAVAQGWPVLVPAWATGCALLLTVAIGGMAGLYPAVRAARLAPTTALAAP
ncbi:putative ABC transport system permease protein [Micromonospora purpureochromogenes]|uniref:Putative ABC transport system permease protein n=1 Tax=Micromonospora purpureochromogenes TaxID=47872 RepID=A0A1C4U7P8_9ACTN|nr:ABC transporter permease [Micromonospora purpureochromogenes]SCE67681.1 putative ABC transport system permease protein [Micromonospora purpureochromogenes]